MQGSDIYTCCLFYFSYRLYHHLCFKLRKQRLWPYVTCSRSHRQTAELGYTCGQTVALTVLSSVTLGKQHLACSVVDVRWCMWDLKFNVWHEATALHMSCIPMQAVFLSGSALPCFHTLTRSPSSPPPSSLSSHHTLDLSTWTSDRHLKPVCS